MKITAIIVCYQSDNLIMECLTAVLATAVSKVIIWDNDPTGTVRDKISPYKDSSVAYHADGNNWGFGGGVNRAIKYADTDSAYLLVNPDCFVTPEAVEKLAAEASRPSTGVVAPRMHYLDGSPGITGGPFPTVRKELGSLTNIDHYLPKKLRKLVLSKLGRSTGGSYHDSMVVGPTTDMDWVSGFCLLITPRAFREVGGFDERFFLYFEDVDICRRVAAAGFKVRLIRDISVLHLESTSTSLSGKSRHYWTALRMYFRIHGNKFQRAVFGLGSPA